MPKYQEMKRRVAPDVLLGKKFISLAVSEPNAGSDVAGIATVARYVRCVNVTLRCSDEGNHFVVNGNKKWITNGTYADYHVTAVRTGNSGELSFLLVESGTPGFKVRKLEIRDSDISGTAYLDFDNCHVPIQNLIGKKNQGNDTL
jgi:alkylation response protein AidB-like acyl-CoA dehydrogenase